MDGILGAVPQVFTGLVTWTVGPWTLPLAVAFVVAVLYIGYRQRYLLIWICGWAFLLVSRAVGAPGTLAHVAPAYLLGSLAFVAAVLLFAASALSYVGALKDLGWAWRLGALAMAAALWQGLSHSAAALFCFQLLYCAVLALAAARLCLFALGRSEAGPWFFAIALLMLVPESSHPTASYQFASEMMLRFSIVLLLLDESGVRARRIQVTSAVINSAIGATEPSAIMQAAMEELRRLYGAKFAWFFRLDGEDFVLDRNIEMPEFLAARYARFPQRESLLFPRDGQASPTAVRVRQLPPALRGELTRAGMGSVLAARMEGKKSVVGMLGFGFTGARAFTLEESRFLATTANQLGIACESLSMVERISHTQQQWLATIDSIDDYILVHDNQGFVLRLNKALAIRLGRPAEELTGKPLASVLPNAAQGCPYCRVARESGAETVDPCFGGFSLVSSSSYAEERGTQLGTVHIVCDRSARRAAEERYRMLFESVHEGVFVSTPEGLLLDCNPAFAHMLGYGSPEEILGIDLAQFFPSRRERELYVTEMARQDFLRDYETVMRRKDGVLVTMMENSFATRTPDGKVERYQGLLLDITEKKRGLEEMQRRNRELGALNAIANTVSRTFDLEEILSDALRRAGELFGQHCDLLLFDAESRRVSRHQSSRPEGDPMREELRELVEGSLAADLAGLELESFNQGELAILSPAARQWFQHPECRSFVAVVMYSQRHAMGFLLISSPEPGQFTETDRNLAIAIGRQLGSSVDKVLLYEETVAAYANLRDTQQQLLQSEKMSAVGELVAGVAHELNNPLTAILGYAQLLETEPIGDRGRDFVHKLYRQAQRTHRVVQNLLSFSRQRKPIHSQVDLRHVLQDTMALRDYDLKLNRINLHREYDPTVPFVTGDAHQLEQVFLNIVNNAVDAIMDSAPSGELWVRTFVEGERVCVEFRDSGPGLKDLSRIFDPFYTTKEVGKGTGLGLSICYGIMKEHGGDITASNHESGGAVFQLWLPVGGPARSSSFATSLRANAAAKEEAK